MKDHGTQAFNNILLATTMENCPDGILVVDATAHVLSFNRRFVEMWAIPPDLIAAGKDEALLPVVTPQMKDAQGFLVRVQHLYAHPDETGHDEIETLDGRAIDRHSAALRDPDEQYLGRVWFFRDISEHKAAEQEIAVLARSDVLTGLANRRTFLDRFNHAFAGARRTGKQFAVLYLDLDSFKAINDAFGHAAGDALLLTVAGRLTKVVRETDLVARFDFGSDQSSIGHLWSSKVSRLKIAPQLIEAMLRDESDTVRSILALARLLGIEIIAESVETEAQRKFLLAGMPTVKAQGYLYSRPVPPVEATALLRRYGMHRSASEHPAMMRQPA